MRRLERTLVLLLAGVFTLASVAGAAAAPWRVRVTGYGSGELDSISCVAARSCMATGAALPVLETKQGWYNVGGVEGGSIACAGRTCQANVFDHQATSFSAAGWNGKRWLNEFAGGQPRSFSADWTGISCAAAVRCLSVGTTEVRTRAGCPLRAPSRLGCVSGTASVERWDGRRWTPVTGVPMPVPAATEPSPTATPTTTTTTPTTTTTTPATTTTTPATTTTTDRVGTPAAIARQTAPPLASGAPSYGFQAVSCARPGSCVAVGSWTPDGALSFGSRMYLFADRLIGDSWRLDALPSPAGVTEFTAISCAAGESCMALAGSGDRRLPAAEQTNRSADSALTLRWNGRRWNLVRPMVPSGSKSLTLTGVSCPRPNWCLAVGKAVPREGLPRPVMEIWDGVRWELITVAQPADLGRLDGAGFAGVSCVAVEVCTAIGDYEQANPVTGNEENWFMESDVPSR